MSILLRFIAALSAIVPVLYAHRSALTAILVATLAAITYGRAIGIPILILAILLAGAVAGKYFREA